MTECGPIAGRDRVLVRQPPDCDRNRGRVLVADENTPLGAGRSSRRAGTRALPEKHPRERIGDAEGAKESSEARYAHSPSRPFAASLPAPKF